MLDEFHELKYLWQTWIYVLKPWVLVWTLCVESEIESQVINTHYLMLPSNTVV